MSDLPEIHEAILELSVTEAMNIVLGSAFPETYSPVPAPSLTAYDSRMAINAVPELAVLRDMGPEISENKRIGEVFNKQPEEMDAMNDGFQIAVRAFARYLAVTGRTISPISE